METEKLMANRILAVVSLACALIVACGGSAPPAGTPQTANPTAEPTAATPPASGTPFHLITPRPTVPEGHWRWTGQIFDETGTPLAGVWVHNRPGENPLQN